MHVVNPLCPDTVSLKKSFALPIPYAHERFKGNRGVLLALVKRSIADGLARKLDVQKSSVLR